jgi:hypothetical protein
MYDDDDVENYTNEFYSLSLEKNLHHHHLRRHLSPCERLEKNVARRAYVYTYAFLMIVSLSELRRRYFSPQKEEKD